MFRLYFVNILTTLHQNPYEIKPCFLMRHFPPSNIQIAIFHDKGKTYGRIGSWTERLCDVFSWYWSRSREQLSAMHFNLCDIFVVGYICCLIYFLWVMFVVWWICSGIYLLCDIFGESKSEKWGNRVGCKCIYSSNVPPPPTQPLAEGKIILGMVAGLPSGLSSLSAR